MGKLVFIELLKLKKTKIVLISFLTVFLIAILSLFQGWRMISLGFEVENKSIFFLEQLLFWNSYYALPAVLVLIGSFSINREKQEGTMNQILIIPVNFLSFVISKLITVVIFSLILSLSIFILGLINQLIIFKNIELTPELFLLTGQYLLNALLISACVFPIICCAIFLKKDYIILVAVAEIYSFLSVFLNNTPFRIFYPISAEMGLIGITSFTITERFVAVIPIIFCILATIFLLKKCKRN